MLPGSCTFMCPRYTGGHNLEFAASDSALALLAADASSTLVTCKNSWPRKHPWRIVSVITSDNDVLKTCSKASAFVPAKTGAMKREPASQQQCCDIAGGTAVVSTTALSNAYRLSAIRFGCNSGKAAFAFESLPAFMCSDDFFESASFCCCRHLIFWAVHTASFPKERLLSHE